MSTKELLLNPKKLFPVPITPITLETNLDHSKTYQSKEQMSFESSTHYPKVIKIHQTKPLSNKHSNSTREYSYIDLLLKEEAQENFAKDLQKSPTKKSDLGGLQMTPSGLLMSKDQKSYYKIIRSNTTARSSSENDFKKRKNVIKKVLKANVETASPYEKDIVSSPPKVFKISGTRVQVAGQTNLNIMKQQKEYLRNLKLDPLTKYASNSRSLENDRSSIISILNQKSLKLSTINNKLAMTTTQQNFSNPPKSPGDRNQFRITKINFDGGFLTSEVSSSTQKLFHTYKKHHSSRGLSPEF